jgi:hypothetical protein
MARLIPAQNIQQGEAWYVATSAGQPATVGSLVAVWVQRTQSVRFAYLTAEAGKATRKDGSVWHLWVSELAYTRR